MHRSLMVKRIIYAVAVIMALYACKIENDIPYPIVKGNIEAFEVEGQCAPSEGGDANAVINTTDRTVTLYVDDTVDLTQLRVTRFTVSSEATILLKDSSLEVSNFPNKGFEQPANDTDTRLDFTSPITFILQTYQDYAWKVSVTQLIERSIDVVGQVSSVIDTENRVAIIYVSPEQSLNNIQVNTLNLGGKSGTVTPDPTTIHDFTQPQKFYVSHGWEETSHEWTVYVYQKEENASGATAFPMTSKAMLSGNIQSGKTPVLEYKEESATTWTTLSESAVTVNGTKYTAVISGLKGGTSYQYRVSIDGVVGEEQSFTTAPATPLTNGTLEDWNSEKKANGTLWNPWAAGSTAFWDTGNAGSTTIGDSNTTPTSETCNGSGKAALLASKSVVLKGLAAGNLFTGDFELDGTHGILTLGRDFSAFPSALRIHCKYTTSPITKVDETLPEMAALQGKNDICHVYIALTSEKMQIKTRQKDEFDPKASPVIAYGEFESDVNVSGNEQNGYKQVDIPLEYYRNETPKYIIIVCSSSKYGNLFTGGVSSQLWLDEMELIYE